MSLKIFHGFFIVISILFTAGFAFYGFNAGAETMGDSSNIWAAVSALFCVALIVYGIFFIRKSRRLP